MSEYFNRHHGTRRRTFRPGDTVYTLSKEGLKPRWIEATILRCKGKVVYDVRVDNEKWRRHANQLRPRPIGTMRQATTPTLRHNVDLTSPEDNVIARSPTRKNSGQQAPIAPAQAPRPASSSISLCPMRYIEELIDSAPEQLTEDDLLEMTGPEMLPGEDDEDLEEAVPENKLTLENLAKGFWLFRSAVDFFYDMDPSLLGPLKLKQIVEEGLVPYKSNF
ncbi:hypothetical protein M514_11291 [Trichuris suis]|uniref:Uncharacterized protein n=1 Tax=Trichuris suis TaxID=68888 RepID=A0A085LS65_9BILA|nr:hypothetical protein M513_11291 [Trichuris suis]KFD62018.1 hypothetical protein M514_11291 [Trichuris suis]